MVCVIFGGQVFCQSVNLSTELGSTKFRTPFCVTLATPLMPSKSLNPGQLLKFQIYPSSLAIRTFACAKIREILFSV